MFRQRWKRTVQCWQRKAGSFKKILLQFATLAVAGLVVLFVALALFSPLLHIREIRVARSDPRIDAEQIQRAVSPLLNEHLFFLSAQQVADLLEASVPDLRGATVTKQYPSTLRVRVTLDPIIARVTFDVPEPPLSGTGAAAGTGAVAVVRESGDYITSEGVYVTYFPSQVQAASGGMLDLRVVDVGTLPDPWTTLVDPQFLNVIRQAEAELASQFGIEITTRQVYLRAREFHMVTPAHTLWFDLRSPLSEQLQRYSMFVQNIGVDEAAEYVDLRLTDKIVYR